jgi:hypothetical protein
MTNELKIETVNLDKERDGVDANYDIAFKGEELEIKKVETQLKREFLKGQEQDRTARDEFSKKIFRLLCCFLFAMFLLLTLSGIECNKFHLSDTILITLITTTTINVISIFVFVVKYLFKANICHKCGIRITQNTDIETK